MCFVQSPTCDVDLDGDGRRCLVLVLGRHLQSVRVFGFVVERAEKVQRAVRHFEDAVRARSRDVIRDLL